MPSRKDLTGQRFGHLVVERMEWQGRPSPTLAHCLCDCGKAKTVYAGHLTRGATQSCGCQRLEQISKALRKDLTGQRFGRLVVESMEYRKQPGRTHAHCVCDCGTVVTAFSTNLVRGLTLSCGCWLADQNAQRCRKDLTGQRFGRLVVQGMEWRGRNKTIARCLCDCGTMADVGSALLIQRKTRSCGCIGSRTAEEKRATVRLSHARRRARKRGLPDHFTREHEIFMQSYWQGCCAMCGAAPAFWHMIAWDHWIPISDPTCPGTVSVNILPLCHATRGAEMIPGARACNNSKGNKDPRAWVLKMLAPRKAKTKLKEIDAYFVAAQAYAASLDKEEVCAMS